MPSLAVIGQQIKEKRRGGTMCPPAYMVPKYPSLNSVKQFLRHLAKRSGGEHFPSPNITAICGKLREAVTIKKIFTTSSRYKLVSYIETYAESSYSVDSLSVE